MSNDTKKPEESQDEKFAKMLANALKEALPAAVTAALQVQNSIEQSKAAAFVMSRPTGEKCSTCRQILPPGCKQGEHKHRKVAVYPLTRKFGPWFQGVFINGVQYISNNLNNPIFVPADCEIENLVRNWELNEERNQEDTGSMSNLGSI